MSTTGSLGYSSIADTWAKWPICFINFRCTSSCSSCEASQGLSNEKWFINARNIAKNGQMAVSIAREMSNFPPSPLPEKRWTTWKNPPWHRLSWNAWRRSSVSSSSPGQQAATAAGLRRLSSCARLLKAAACLSPFPALCPWWIRSGDEGKKK